MSTLTRLLVIATTLGAGPVALAADDNALPRYQFQPGQILVFHASSSFHYGEGKKAGEHGLQSDWTVWVLRKNPDGSYHLVLRDKSTFSQTFQEKKHDQPARIEIVYADVFPDGRVLMNKTIESRGHPSSLFPQLPRDPAEAKSGWASSKADEKTDFKPLSSSGTFAFTGTTDSPMNKIYLSSSKATYTFDATKGFVTQAETENTQGYAFKGKGTGKMALVSVKKMDDAALRDFTAASDVYFATARAYDNKVEAASKAPPEKAKAMLTAAVADLKAAVAKLKSDELRADLEKKVQDHNQMEQYYLQSAESRAKIMGKPAAEFDTTTIEGKKVKLTDLRGHVVVLDFWYRGCGWCIKAMPQINQLADDFAGKPVMIFGMNTDRNEEDARFVIDKMGLKYPTLKAEGLPEKFGVSGFPTLIIIDQRGKVHDIHVGYTSTLREDVGRQIKGLLDKS